MADSGITASALAVMRQTGDDVRMWRTRLAECLLADADDLAASIIDAVAKRVDAPQLFNRPEQVQQVTRATAGLIQALAAWIVDPRPEIADAEVAWSQATGDLTGRNGVPLADLLAGHRIALARLQELLVARSADWADSAVDAAEGLALMSSFSEALIPRMTAAHAVGARLRAETLDATRLAAIRAVLAGGPFDEARLGIRAARSHVGVAASGPAAERLGVVLRAADAGAVLVAAPISHTSWAWCDSERLRLDALNGLGGWVGVGQPAVGIPGFIASHQQALLALEVALRGPVGTIRYENVAVQALVWGGPAAAEQLVAHALGGLAGPGGHTGRVRETLGAWVDCACSAAETARRLHLSERTVRYHLQRAADLRGQALDKDLPALATALRIADQLPGND